MAPRISIPSVFAAGGALGFGYYLVMRKHWFPDLPSSTTGVENIEARYTAGGGAPNHQPATATARGDSSSTEARHTNADKGPDSERFNKEINEQTKGGIYPDKFYETQYNNPKGK